MAGTLIIDKIQTDNSFLTLNVGQTQIATMNASGIYSNTNTLMIGANGTVSNTAIAGFINGSQLASNTVSNTNIQTGAIENYSRGVGLLGMRNRIINGAMVIDQRNAGASVTIGGGNTYTLDRFSGLAWQASKYSIQQNASAVTPPVGFTNYLGATSLSAYTVGAAERFAVRHTIEGYNVADLGWGSANAKTITLSFWAYSSLTGTFGGALRNDAGDRSYPFSYSIPVANTWTQIAITITGSTSGTWGTTNNAGIPIWFSLGTGSTYSGTAGAWANADYSSATGATSVVGTNGATFYITGVQLEVGSSATGFEYRQYGQELALCQRYFEKSYPIETAPAENIETEEPFKTGIFTAGSLYGTKVNFVVTKRTAPTMTYYRPTQSSTNGQWAYYTSAWNTGTGTSTDTAGVNGFSANINASLTGQNAYIVSGGWTASSEL